MRLLNKIFTKIITAFVACVIVMPSAGAAVSNLPFTEIGDYGNWMTADNILQFDNAVSEDIKNFQPQANQSVSDYVPIEAKAGLALMNGLSMVSDVLDSSLVRFAIIFMILAYVFWIMFEAYAMIKNGTSAMEFGEKAVKKAAVILIWSIILIITETSTNISTPGIGTKVAPALISAWRSTCRLARNTAARILSSLVGISGRFFVIRKN